MSKPSFSNIDLWLFELSEGNLSPEQVQQLELFLLQHPEFDVDRDMWEVAKVDKTPVEYPAVEDLERKDRPVAFYAISSLVMLFLMWGSYSYFTVDQAHDELSASLLEKQREEIRTRILHDLSVDQNNKAQTGTNGTQHPDVDDLNNQASSSLHAGSVQTSVHGNYQFASNETNTGTTGSPFQSVSSHELNAINLRGGGLNGQRLKVKEIPLIATLSDVQMKREIPSENHSVYSEPDELAHNEDLADWTLKENLERIGISEDESKVRDPRTARSFEFANELVRTRRVTPRYSAKNGYNTSLKTKITRLGRSVRRMMDNPVALQNSRDPLYLVPGLTANDISFSSAGTLLATRVLASSRIQWLGKPNEQLMSQVSVDGYSYGIRGGWGVQVNHSMYNDGGIHVGQLALSYSPKISISNRISVEPSVRFKMGNKHLDVGRMEGVEQVELDRGSVNEFYANGDTPIGRNLWYKDLGLGLLVNTKWFFVGAQVDNIFRYKDNIYSTDLVNPRRAENTFIATAGTDLGSKYSDISVSPYLVYQKNERLSELWAGATMNWSGITVGLAASTNMDPAASLGMKFDHFSLTYKADYTKSIMTQERSLSHQVTVRFLTKQTRFKRH